jgi:hypothetical protein
MGARLMTATDRDGCAAGERYVGCWSGLGPPVDQRERENILGQMCMTDGVSRRRCSSGRATAHCVSARVGEEG